MSESQRGRGGTISQACNVCETPMVCPKQNYAWHALPDREALGKKVREVRIAWTASGSSSPTHHMLPWEDLDEGNKEVDRRIAETILGIRDWRVGRWCRCGEAVTHFTIDGSESKEVCGAYPNCRGAARDTNRYADVDQRTQEVGDAFRAGWAAVFAVMNNENPATNVETALAAWRRVEVEGALAAWRSRLETSANEKGVAGR